GKHACAGSDDRGKGFGYDSRRVNAHAFPIRRISCMRSFLKLCAALALALASGVAAAQTWPAKPVRIMVGASPGGGTDIIARMLAEAYQATFGQPFIVENRPGAANTIAADLTAKAPADG